MLKKLRINKIRLWGLVLWAGLFASCAMRETRQIPPVFTVSSATITLTGTEPGSVTFEAPAPWVAKVSKGADWMVLHSSEGGEGTARIECAARDANENVGEREGIIQVTIGLHTLEIPVVQLQRDVIRGDEEALALPFDATEFSLRTQYNVDYEVRSSVEWMQWVQVKSPLHEGVEEFVIAPNTRPEARKGELLFTSESHPGASYTVTVEQGGKDPILSIISPGFYGTGRDVVKGADGWIQSSYLKKPDGSIRYRLLNAGTLEVATLTGLSVNDKRGDTCTLHLSLTNSPVKREADYSVTLLYTHNGMSWFKGENGVYFIVKE